MDSLFGIGPLELFVVLIIAGIVMGPERIAQTARWLGKLTAQLQGISRGFALQLRNELDTIDSQGDIREAWQAVNDLQREVSDLRKQVLGVGQDTQKVIAESKAAVQNSIRPPQFDAPTADPPPPNGHSSLPQPLQIPDDNE